MPISELLKDLTGRKAVVYSRGGASDHQDMGTIEAIDDEVIKLRKENEVVYIERSAIRLIKP
ncbi:MAG: hypothetical protein C4320_08035, partial [Armatimonadota bacterium]